MPSIFMGFFHIPGIFCKNSGIFSVNVGLLLSIPRLKQNLFKMLHIGSIFL